MNTCLHFWVPLEYNQGGQHPQGQPNTLSHLTFMRALPGRKKWILVFSYVFIFETECHYVALAGLELAV